MKLDTPTSGSELTAEAVAVLEAGHKATPPTFVRDLYGRVPSEDLACYSPQALADLAAEAYEHLKAPRTADGAGYPPPRRGGRARGPPPRRDGARDRQRQHALPAQFDPRRDRRPGLRAAARGPSDPGRGARSQPARCVRLVGEATARRCGWREARELHPIHLPRIDDAETRDRLIEAMRRVHADVALAVHDWPGMRARVTEIVHELPPQPAAAAGRRGRRRRSPSSNGSRRTTSPSWACANTACRRATPRPIRCEGSGLGLLRDPDRARAAPRPRARRDDAGDPRLPGAPAGAHHHQGQREVPRPSPRPSRLYRRQALRRRWPARRASCASSACSPSSAYTNTTGEVPYLRHKVAKVVGPRGLRSGELCRPRAPQRARELSARRAVPDRRGHALPLRHRHHEPVGASARAGAGARRRVRPLRLGARLRAEGPLRHAGPPAHRRVPGRHLRRARLRLLSGLSGRPARAHPLHHRPRRGRRRRRSPRETLEKRHRRHRAHLGRRAARRARRHGRRRPGARARVPLRRGLQRRLSRGLRRRAGDRRTSASWSSSPRRGPAPSISTAARATPRPASTSRCSRAAQPLPLSERVPLLENLGFRVVNERTYRVASAGVRTSASGCTT